MLEIIGLIFLCKINKRNAIAAGKSGGGAIGLTLGLWIGLEFVGAFIGGVAELGFGSYILALVFAAIGAVTSYAIAKSPSKNPGVQSAPGGQYYPGQTPMPQPQEYADPYPKTGAPVQNRFCMRCGQQLMAGAMFCGACGTPVSTAAQPNAPQQAAATPMPIAPPVTQAPTISQQAVTAAAALNQPPKAGKHTNIFYVFAVQGPAFGMAEGGDMVMEKAQKLKDNYGPAKDMDLKIVRPGQWNANIESSNSGGVVSVSYNFGNFRSRIGEYLRREGIPGEIIENGVKISEDNSLQLSNPMSGVFVMGIPLVFEGMPDVDAEAPPAPEPAPQPLPMSCPHEYKHFACVKCGEKAPKPQLVSQGLRKQNQYTYEDYTAGTTEEAKYFLEQTAIVEPNYYVMVHTPEGDWGRDKDSVFLSRLCGFQRDLTLRQCDAKPALMPERIQDAQMAANKVTDNYLLSVTCGACGFTWIDGVGYRMKTIVKCPECGQYNLADTEHIRFNNL